MLKSLQRLPIQGVCALSIVASLLGCSMAIQKLEPALDSRYSGFIQDGKTTKQELQDRLGPPHSSYENGTILIYRVYLKEDGRMTLIENGLKEDFRMTLLGKGSNGTCHVFVLVFDKDNILERHSLVKYGCQREGL